MSELEEPAAPATIAEGQATSSDSANKDGAASESNGVVFDSLSQLDRKGVALGCFVLARCLQLGQAVAKNERKAYEYYNKAIKFDKRVVADLHDKLTYGQLW